MVECLVDGQAVTTVPADDRGLLYGDGLFETIVFVDRAAPLWPYHWQRLVDGCSRLGLPAPDESVAHAECLRLAPSREPVIVRFTLTRGSGGRGYFPSSAARARRIVQSRPWPDNYRKIQRDGLRLHTSPVRLAVGSSLAGLKHANRLEQVQAARACTEAGFDEALLFDARGYLAEAIASNVVLELDGDLVAPVSDSGVEGVGLSWLTAQTGTDLLRRRVSADDLGRASAVMVINSVAGPRPVVVLDDRRLAPGECCRSLQSEWNKILDPDA